LLSVKIVGHIIEKFNVKPG